MVRVLINGVEPVNQPIGVDGISERFYYSTEFFAWITELTGSLTFWGNDFDTFYQIFRTGSCDSVPVEIQEKADSTWKSVFVGIIYIKDLSFNIDNRTVDAEIVDDSFVGRILNYADTNIELFTPKTKNGLPINITPATIDVVDLTGSVTSNITCYNTVDTLDYICKWLTDNNVELQSNFLSTNYSDYYYIKGADMRKDSDIVLYVTFKDMITDLCKMLNMRWAVTIVNGQTIIRLENAEFFEQSTYFQLDGYKEFVLSNNDKLDYASFTFGSGKSINTDYDTSTSYIRKELTLPWGGASRSTITANGNCATQRDFNLQTSITCYDPNSISDCLNNVTDTQYDELIFICNDESNAEATLIPTVRLHNFDLFCKFQLARWLKSYCFQYPDSISGCDSHWRVEDTNYEAFPGLDIGFLEPINAGCYFNGFEIPTSVTVNIELKLDIFCDVANQPLGATNGDIAFSFTEAPPAGTNYIAPDTANGWISGTAIPGTPLVEIVQQNILVGETKTYYGELENILIPIAPGVPGHQLTFNILAGDIVSVTILPTSYIKVRASVFDIMKDLTCDDSKFQCKAKGYLMPTMADAIRQEVFRQMILTNIFKNFSGNILELNRKIINGETDITIQMRTS